MENPHKQVVTTYPVAIKMGQGQVHVQKPIPWHDKSNAIKCPECDVVFIASVGFAQEKLVSVLKQDHVGQKNHADVIPLEPDWTKITACTCGM